MPCETLFKVHKNAKQKVRFKNFSMPQFKIEAQNEYGSQRRKIFAKAMDFE